MYRIIIFGWYTDKIFKTNNIPFAHNQDFDVEEEDKALDKALEIAKVCLECNVNVMIKKYPDKKIIWVAVDDRGFSQR